MSVEVVKDYLPWAPPLLTLAGWFLVNWQNNTRERRKDARAAADRCKVLVRESAQSAMKYWQGQPDTFAWQVKAFLEELEVEIRRFSKDKGREALNIKFVDLVEAIAGENFESVKMQKKQASDPILRDISRAKQAFLHEVENQFERHYH